MPATFNRCILIIAIGIAAAASLASSAYAGPRVSIGTLSALQKAALEISPGELGANSGASTARPTYISPAPLTPLQIAALEISPGSLATGVVQPATAVQSHDGFRWDDAGIGAAVILLLSAAVGTAVTIGRRRGRRLVAQ